MSLRTSGVALFFVVLAAGYAVAAQERPNFEDSPFLRIDPDKILLSGNDSRVPCGECHVDEFAVWEETAHATGFNTLHRSDGAADILQNMDLQVAKRGESLCMRCHYTVDSSLRAIAGVSCESCHGAARDWLDIHNDLGAGVERPEQELEEHRVQRIQQSLAAGMLRPSGDLYSVAANCFECHTVPMEELVNKGRHSTGSSRFELVEWAENIRHNYREAQWEAGSGNQAPTAERSRVTYAVGRILDYEFGLRGLAKATEEGRYSKGMERRVSQAYRALEAIATAEPIQEVVEVLRLGKDLPLGPGNERRLLAAAESIRTLGQAFTGRSDGTELAALDGLVAGNTVAVPEGAPPPPVEATQTGVQPGQAAPTPAVAAGEAGSQPSAPATALTQAVSTVGSVQRRPEWVSAPDPRFQTTDPGCSCHGDAEDWYFSDPHESSHFALLNQQPKAVGIATRYGISPSEMTLGNQMCMTCHGMPLSATPTAQVTVGVGCESCHGGSSQYLDPHEDGGNPQLGMINLNDAATRAATCSQCHLITDARLLSAGHPSGSGYDIATATASIEHFPEGRVERSRGRRGESYAPLSGAALSSAYAAVRGSRPVPQVEVIALVAPTRGPAPVGGNQRPPARTSPRASTTGGAAIHPPVRRPPPRPARGARTQGPTPRIELPPLPEVDDATPAEEILLLIKERIEALRRAVGRGS